jgi:hypothetical protein
MVPAGRGTGATTGSPAAGRWAEGNDITSARATPCSRVYSTAKSFREQGSAVFTVRTRPQEQNPEPMQHHEAGHTGNVRTWASRKRGW